MSVSLSSSRLPLLPHLVPPKIVMGFERNPFDALSCFKFPGFFVICTYNICISSLHIFYYIYGVFSLVFFVPLSICLLFGFCQMLSPSLLSLNMCISLFLLINFSLICLIVSMRSCVLLFFLNPQCVFFNDVSIMLLTLSSIILANTFQGTLESVFITLLPKTYNCNH